MTIQDLKDYASNKRSNDLDAATVTYNAVEYPVSSILVTPWLHLYSEATLENSSATRKVLLPTEVIPSTLTNGQIISFVRSARDVYQRMIDVYFIILGLIDNETLTTEGSIDTRWATELTNYTKLRTVSSSTETLGINLSSLTTTVAGLGSPVQADWTQASSGALDYIKHKPTLATVATSGSYNDLGNKPSIPSAQIQSDWTQASSGSLDYIKNKPGAVSYPTRAFGTSYLAASNLMVNATVSIASVLTLGGGQTGTVVLQYADNTGFTSNVVTVSSCSNGNTGTLSLGLNLTQTISVTPSGVIPSGKYYRITSSGTATNTLSQWQEVTL